jgi:hypothetical protein
MATREELTDLAEKLEALKEPSAELDLAIGLALAGWEVKNSGVRDREGFWHSLHGDFPSFTGSMDEAINLMLDHFPNGSWWRSVTAIGMIEKIDNADPHDQGVSVDIKAPGVEIPSIELTLCVVKTLLKNLG